MHMEQLWIENMRQEGLKVLAELKVNNKTYTVTTTFNEVCFPYITIDRIDAYVLGLIYFAMRNGYDIYSEMPISEQLYYNLEYHLIDALIIGNPHLHRVKVIAPIVTSFPDTERQVLSATGISCGVDSLYTVATHSNLVSLPSFTINSLCFFNIGAGFKGEETVRTPLIEGRIHLAHSFCKEYGYRFLFVESDFHLVMNQIASYSHIENCTYVNLFCVLHLQKEMKRYYISSADSYSFFTVNNPANSEKFSSDYDLLTCMVASINGMSVYSAGGNIKRIEKTRFLGDNYPPSYKYLNVCVEQVHNDSTCFKCIRTLLSIDAVCKGGVSLFNAVFDIPYYLTHKKEYIRRMWINAVFKRDDNYYDIIPYFKKEITLGFKVKAILSIVMNKSLGKLHWLKMNKL